MVSLSLTQFSDVPMAFGVLCIMVSPVYDFFIYSVLTLCKSIPFRFNEEISDVLLTMLF